MPKVWVRQAGEKVLVTGKNMIRLSHPYAQVSN